MDAMLKELERLRMQNAALQKEVVAAKKGCAAGAKRVPEITYKVSTKGAVSVYGLQKFPITLYKDQWARLLDKADDIKLFIEDNDALLSTKAQVAEADSA